MIESYYVYVIRSGRNRRYYVGSCGDIDNRLREHNSGETKSTKYGIPWKIIYTERFATEKEAYRREREIKSYKGGNAFKKLIS